jgi:hypothetical protein
MDVYSSFFLSPYPSTLLLSWSWPLCLEVLIIPLFLISFLSFLPFFFSGRCRLNDNSTSRNDTSMFCSGDEVMMEVNMNVRPHTLHFFRNGQQEKPYSINIPDSVYFVVSLSFLFISSPLSSLSLD